MTYHKILHGDALVKLKELESESVDCCITSPPYWALRDYKVEGQLGQEPTFNEYLDKLIAIFDEVKRVLTTKGSCYVNIGDTYSGSGGAGGDYNNGGIRAGQPKFKQIKPTTIPAKSLCMIPERFAIGMIDRGWVLRNKIVWYKRNCMPSSAKDRYTIDYELIYFFTKSSSYHFETQYEPLSTEIDQLSQHNAMSQGWDPASELYEDWYLNSRTKKGWHNHEADKEMGNGQQKRGHEFKHLVNPLGRIKRCVWDIPTESYPDLHFAVYPTALVEPMIKASCPVYVCSKCLTPRRMIYLEKRVNTRPGLDVGNAKSGKEADPNAGLHNSDLSKYRQKIVRYPKIGGNKHSEGAQDGQGHNNTYSGNRWEPVIEREESELTDCGCNAEFRPGIVLDPFMGSGTTGEVALSLARNFIGIELNGEYIQKQVLKRLDKHIHQQRLF